MIHATQVNLKTLMLSEKKMQRFHTAWFHLHKILESSNDSINDRKQISYCLGIRGGVIHRKGLQRGTRKLLRVKDMFIIL